MRCRAAGITSLVSDLRYFGVEDHASGRSDGAQGGEPAAPQSASPAVTGAAAAASHADAIEKIREVRGQSTTDSIGSARIHLLPFTPAPPASSWCALRP